jgi:hypothetical protein
VTWLHDSGSLPEWETDANGECGLTEEIEREIGIKIEFEPTGDEEKRKFTDKTQDELIELLIRAQVRVLLSSLPRASWTSVQGVANGGFLRMRLVARSRPHHQLLLEREVPSRTNHSILLPCLHLLCTSTSNTNCPKVAILAWVSPPEATKLLKLKHSSNSNSGRSKAARQEAGKCQRQEWIGAPRQLNPKRNRTRLAGKTHHRMGAKIVRAVEMLADGKMRNQQFKIRLRPAVHGAQFRIRRLQQE